MVNTWHVAWREDCELDAEGCSAGWQHFNGNCEVRTEQDEAHPGGASDARQETVALET